MPPHREQFVNNLEAIQGSGLPFPALPDIFLVFLFVFYQFPTNYETRHFKRK